LGRMLSESRTHAYQADTPHEYIISGKSMEDIDDPLNPLHELAMIISSRDPESFCLHVKDVDDGGNRFTGHELVEDLMLDQVDP
jgi:hypothetical protein